MSELPKTCLNCGGESLYSTKTRSAGGLGPELLPDLGGSMSSAAIRVVLCSECGHTSFFAELDACQTVAESSRRRRT